MTARSETKPGNPAVKDASRPWLVAALLLTAVVTLLLLFLPLITVSTTSIEQRGVDGTIQSSDTERSRESFAEQQGVLASLLLAVPILVCAVPLLFPSGRRRLPAAVAAVVLGLAALLGIASVGLFYLPSVALLVVAAVRAGPAGDRRS